MTGPTVSDDRRATNKADAASSGAASSGAAQAAPAGAPPRPPAFPQRSRHRRRGWRRGSLAATVVVVLVVGVTIVTALVRRPGHPEPMGPGLPAGSWAERESAGSAPVTDSRGQVWKPAGKALTGGHRAQAAVPAQQSDSASPALYQTMQVGVSSWRVHVPASGRYAVDVLMVTPGQDQPGQRVFDVLADNGNATTPLVRRLDLAALAGAGHPFHVTGTVPVTSGTLTLRFQASAGEPVASALAVTSDGGTPAGKVLFHDDFSGPAGAAPDPAARCPR